MNLLIWKLHRNQVIFAALALGVVATLLLVTGSVMAHDYRVFFANCAATRTCQQGAGQLFSGDGAIIDLVNFTLVVPLLFGLFWGAPLLAKEFEEGTQSLAWTQGVARRRWMSANVAWALVAGALWGGALSALVSWWRIPEDALDGRFGTFDLQGVVPVAYSLFAVALGIAAGSIIKRLLPALAVTLGCFVAVRIAVAIYLRPRFISPVTQLTSIAGSKGGAPAGAWVISSALTGPKGQNLGHSVSLGTIPSACRSVGIGEQGISAKCMSAHGFHQLVSFQPDSRFWAFQGIESAIFVALSAVLVLIAFRFVLRRDA